MIFNSDGLQGIHWKLLLITSLLIIFAFIFSGCDQFGLEQPGALSQGKEPLAADLSGGGVWIEFPPEGSELPKEPVTIVVYATGSTSGINLSANGQTIPSGPIEQLIEGGSLVRMDALWMPPEDGEYTINATSGGGSASISVCIGACQPEPDTPEPTGTKTITPTASTTPGTETPTVTVSPTTDTSQDLYIEFYVDPAYIDAGNCADVIWYVEGGNGTYLDGTYVSNSGTQTVCPCETTTYNLSVEKPDQEFEERWATLEVSGYCDVETEEPEPPVDTEGPSISSPSLVWEGCDIYLQANVSDPSGVAWATYYYNLNGGGWNSITMSNVGGDTWISDAGVPVSDGIETPLGTIQYYVEAGDNLGNISQSSSGSYDYTGCG